MKKYEFTDDTITVGSAVLRRIKALKNFRNVNAGDLGGYIEKEENLSHDGGAWIFGGATVYDNADYTAIKGFGRGFRTTTFFRQRDKSIGVVCGCFYGTLEEFRKKVKETHGNSKYAKEYLMIADLMETHFKG